MRQYDLIYKLQRALQQKHILITVNQEQFFSSDKNRFIKVWILKKDGKVIFRACGNIDVIKFMSEILKNGGIENGGEQIKTELSNN